MRSSTFALGVAFFISATIAAPRKVQQGTISGATTQCYTSWDTTKLSTKVATQWQTTTTSYTSTTTSTETSTSTPEAFTTTSTIQTATTITALTSTSVQTDISLITTIVTSTTNSIDISTATETSTSTPTVAAPSGFIPVQSSISGSAWDGLSGTPSGKRSLAEALKAVLEPRSKAHPHYKQGVICEVFVPENPAETAYATVISTETASTPTSIAFWTNTITFVIVPLASTTITSISTVTDTSVATEVQSSTTTTTQISTATTSVLAACATNNNMDTINGQVINGWNGFSQFTSQQLNSAYDCCQFAFSYNRPITNWVLRSGTCYLGINADNQCSQTSELYYVQYGGVQGVAGNGPCGQGQA